jgi:Amt family ammonium transporter
VFGWLIPERIRHGKATTIGAATGAVAGLVAITPASGYVGPLPALAIGFAAGLVCFFAVSLKSRLRLDDSLDVVGVHLVGGIVGALLTGVFASLVINPAGAAGGVAQFGKQAAAVGITLGFSFLATLVILKIVDLVVGLRASDDDEDTGLDLSQHGEAAYSFSERGAAVPHESVSIADIGEVPDEVIRRAVERIRLEMAREESQQPDPTS